MKQTELERHVSQVIAPVIQDMGFRLVWVNFQGGILQILAENPATGNLGLEECTRISRAISPVLEVEDPISGPYRLEVSSPGIERPLITAEDFRKYAGLEAKIELDAPLPNGQRRFK